MAPLVLPEGVLAQHLTALGKTGSGKSSVLRLLVEELLDAGKPVCIVDPKGDWWGLKSSGDGRRAGYPIVIFGGEHADVPINTASGAHIAELVATGNRPCIIDLGGWMVGDRTRFFIDFASTLFRHARGPRHLVIDEVHNFAPQGKVIDPDAGKMLHWANRLASEGRGKGITILSASQRPQKVHKDFLTAAETLIAMRVIHPLDRNAIKDWIDGCPDAEKGKEVLQSLASMSRGTGWVWSPEIGFGPVRVTFRKFSTYDSFKAPTGESSEKLKGWAEVDLAEVKAKLESVVREQQKNDPRLLRTRIAELERAARSPAPAAIDEAAIAMREGKAYANGRTDGYADGYAKGIQAGKAIEALEELKRAILAIPKPHGDEGESKAHSRINSKAVPNPSTGPHRVPAAAKPSNHGENSGASQVVSGGLRRILIALAQRPSGLTRRQIAVRAGLSNTSGTFSTYLSTVRSNGWAETSSSLMRITQAGLAVLGEFEPLPTGRGLLDFWITELGGSGAARILRAAAERYPNPITRAQAAAQSGMSETSGTMATYISKLRSLELITGRGELRASDELFE